MILNTKVLGQGWEQMITEFGANQPVDATCSFGKKLFEKNIRNIRPPGIELNQGS
jgi:hypothetical protein